MESVDLNQILRLLDSENIAQVVSIKHDQARESYRLQRTTVNSYEEFHEEIIAYHQHHHQCIYGAPMPPEMASGVVRQIIDRQFSRQGGYESAFVEAKTGIMGGLRNILDRICDVLKHDHEEKYITHIFHTYVGPLNWEAQVSLMRQYMEKFRAIAPPELLEKSPEQLARDYEYVIRTHVQSIRPITSVFRRYF